MRPRCTAARAEPPAVRGAWGPGFDDLRYRVMATRVAKLRPP